MAKPATTSCVDSEDIFNNAEFIACIFEAKGGYLKFGEKQGPERHLGSIFPKDEAPLRSTLGNLRQGTNGRRPSLAAMRKEDPWTTDY